MNLTRAAIGRSHFAGASIVMLVAVGLWAFAKLPSQEDPTFTVREAVVTTFLPGMAPSRVEDLVTRRIEEAARKLPEVEHITSISRTGLSVVHVNLHDRYFDLDPIWQDLRSRVEEIRPTLPRAVRGPFVDDDFGRVAVATFAITADGFTMHEMSEVAEDLRDALYTVPGTSRIDLYGVQEERIYLEMNDARLARHGLRPRDLARALESQNAILPSGRMELGGLDVVFEPTGAAQSVDEIRRVQVALPGGGTVTLEDLASIERRPVDPPRNPVFFDGEPSVVVAVAMDPGESIVAFGDRLAERVREFETGLPVGYRIAFATFQPQNVRDSSRDFTSNLLQTLVILMGVTLVFLGLRTGLVAALMVPLTILVSVIWMDLLDIPLHRVSVAALIISLGMLVDNGIVMTDEIRTRILAGLSRNEAAIAAGRELAVPLLSSCLTTTLAFAPLLLAEHSSAEYLRSLAQVIAITLLSSWLLALLVTPILCIWLIRAGSGDKPVSHAGRFYDLYRSLLDWILGHRGLVIGAMLLLFLVSLAGLRFVPRQFFPPVERPQLIAYVDLPAGSSVSRTVEEVHRLGAWLGDDAINPEIVDHIAYVGAGGPRFVLSYRAGDPAPNRAVFILNLEPDVDVDPVLARIRIHAIEECPELRVRVRRFSPAAEDPGLVELRVSGPERDVVAALAARVEDLFYAVPGVTDVQNDWENLTPKIVLRVDQAQAQRVGVSSAGVAQSLETAFDGVEIGEFRDGEDTIPIVLRLEEARRHDLEGTRTVGIFSENGKGGVPLIQVAYFDVEYEYATIRRRDLERTIAVSGRHPQLAASELAARLQPGLDALALPNGYQIQHGGELEAAAEANAALFAALPLCFAGMVLLLIWQFNSVRRALIIVLTIPLSLIGAVAGLLLAGAPLGFTALLGLISLAGMIVFNAIVLIERVESGISAGEAPRQALLAACVERLRPIVITNLTTILGLIPLMLFGGALWYSMSVVIFGGLLVGTILTLGVVPALYSLMLESGTGR